MVTSRAVLDWASVTAWLILLISIITRIVMNGWSGYVWPTPDGFPYFEGTLNPVLANHDYFTAASMAPNPRHAFYGLVEIGTQLGVGYYQIIFCLWMVIAVAVPSLCYKVLCVATGPRLSASGRVLLALAIALWATVYDHRFSVASWMPLPADATAQGVSLAVGLATLLLVWNISSPWRYVGVVLGFGFAAYIHPVNAMAVGLFWIISGILTVPTWRQWLADVACVMSACLVSALLLVMLYGSQLDVEGAVFIESYVKQAQPYHYHLPFILGQYKTWINLIPIGIIACCAWWWSQNRAGRFFSAATLILGPLILLTQYFSVDILAHPKLVMLGPARFFMVVPWLAVVALALHARIAPFELLGRPSMFRSYWVVVVLILVGLFFAARPADNPIDRLSDEKRSVVEWVADHTQPSDLIFSNSPSMESAIRHFSQRPVLIGKNFPFTPNKLTEYTVRQELAMLFAADPQAGARQLSDKKSVAWIVVKGPSVFDTSPVFVTARGEWRVYGAPFTEARSSDVSPQSSIR